MMATRCLNFMVVRRALLYIFGVVALDAKSFVGAQIVR